MGTGVGEAMLISAVTGAGASAVTGGDPLKGALMGAALGGVGAGVAGAGAGATTSAAAAPISTVPTAAAGSGAGIGATGTAMGATTGAAGAAPITSMGLPTVPGQVGMSTLPSGAMSPSFMTPSGDISLLSAQAPSAASMPPSNAMFPSINQFYARNPVMMPAGLGIAGAAMVPPKALDEDEKYSGPLSRFRYDPDRYRRSFAEGGIMDLPATRRLMQGGHLGSYSDGGRLLKGPGDGMSDHIPAKIGDKQPARLADGEFVIPADVVSGLGNGSTDAGARKLYAMMDKVRQARTGKKSQGKEINANKYMPA